MFPLSFKKHRRCVLCGYAGCPAERRSVEVLFYPFPKQFAKSPAIAEISAFKAKDIIRPYLNSSIYFHFKKPIYNFCTELIAILLPTVF